MGNKSGVRYIGIGGESTIRRDCGWMVRGARGIVVCLVSTSTLGDGACNNVVPRNKHPLYYLVLGALQ